MITMRLLGHGIDIIELERIRARLGSSHDDWLVGVFTADERELADPPPGNVAFFAGRFAAKEAVAKALGTGFNDAVSWLDIEILRTATGAPEVKLSSGALDVATTLGVTQCIVSISHSGNYAVASAILTSSEE